MASRLHKTLKPISPLLRETLEGFQFVFVSVKGANVVWHAALHQCRVAHSPKIMICSTFSLKTLDAGCLT